MKVILNVSVVLPFYLFGLFLSVGVCCVQQLSLCVCFPKNASSRWSSMTSYLCCVSLFSFLSEYAGDVRIVKSLNSESSSNSILLLDNSHRHPTGMLATEV